MAWNEEVSIWRAEFEEPVLSYVRARVRRLPASEVIAKVSQAWAMVEPASAASWDRYRARPNWFMLRWARLALVLCQGKGPYDGLAPTELLAAWRSRHRTVPLAVAEEIIQIALLKVLAHLRAGRMNDEVLVRMDRLEKYVLRTADRCFIDALRRREREDRRQQRLSYEQPTTAPSADEDSALKFRQREDDLTRMGLTDAERELVMRRDRGDTWEEIAEDRCADELAAGDPGQREANIDRFAARLRKQFSRLPKRYPDLGMD